MNYLYMHVPISYINMYSTLMYKQSCRFLSNLLLNSSRSTSNLRDMILPEGGPSTYFLAGGYGPALRHPNPGLNQKFANVYMDPGVNQIHVSASTSIHYIYVAPNYTCTFQTFLVLYTKYMYIISKDPINNK